MSTALPSPDCSASTPDRSVATLPTPQTSRQKRVLACVLCQQRKVKCDRKFPCANCTRSRAQCVPSTLATRRRRHRFPERELLERLRTYENLLRSNNIKFESFFKDPVGDKGPLNAEGGYDSDDEHLEGAEVDWPSPAVTAKSDRAYEAKSILRALNHGSQEPEDDSDTSSDDVNEFVLTKAWNKLFENDDHLLFGSRQAAVELSTLHPEPAQIFKLWQIYLENVSPLLKVTHTPSLQGRIVDAISNVANINPILEALMFSIYCTAILSLAADDVQAMLGSPKEDLLTRYQFGCRQALLNCGILRCNDRDCLTALFLYLVSVRSNTLPRSLSSMLGVAIRIAQRMGIHSESDLAKCTILEAEMRRRLWWSLVLFDARISEMTNYKTTKLTPTWDCKIPLNVNDSDLRPEMKEPPEAVAKSTEALFAVVRGELGEFVRNTMFYLDFTAPALKPIAKNVQSGPAPEGSELVVLEKMVEEKYLKSCDPDNPLHFMTIWSTRVFLAKHQLLEHHSIYSCSSVPQTDDQRDAAVSHAIKLLECDTKLTASPLTKGFLWLANLYFPFPAYIQIVQNLRRRPICDQAVRAWEVMNNNYEARFGLIYSDDTPFFKLFAKIILQAWEARDTALRKLGESITPPKFVASIRHVLAQAAQGVQNNDMEQPHDIMGLVADDFLMSMPMDFGTHMYSTERQASYAGIDHGAYSQIPGRIPLDVDVNYLEWSAMNWNSAGHVGPRTHIPEQTPFDSSGGPSFGGW